MKEINDFLKKCFTMSPSDKVFGGKVVQSSYPSLKFYSKNGSDLVLLAETFTISYS